MALASSPKTGRGPFRPTEQGRTGRPVKRQESEEPSVRSLRAYLTNPLHPLPHYRMKEPHVIARKPRTTDGKGPITLTVTDKIQVRRSDFDAWMQTYRYTPDLDRLVDEVVRELRQ